MVRTTLGPHVKLTIEEQQLGYPDRPTLSLLVYGPKDAKGVESLKVPRALRERWSEHARTLPRTSRSSTRPWSRNSVTWL